jgi:hypothetical protein
MESSGSLTEFTLCQIPGKAYEKSFATFVVSSGSASLQLSRFGKSKPENGAFLDVVLKETVLFAEGGSPIATKNFVEIQIFVICIIFSCNSYY